MLIGHLVSQMMVIQRVQVQLGKVTTQDEPSTYRVGIGGSHVVIGEQDCQIFLMYHGRSNVGSIARRYHGRYAGGQHEPAKDVVVLGSLGEDEHDSASA